MGCGNSDSVEEVSKGEKYSEKSPQNEEATAEEPTTPHNEPQNVAGTDELKSNPLPGTILGEEVAETYFQGNTDKTGEDEKDETSVLENQEVVKQDQTAKQYTDENAKETPKDIGNDKDDDDPPELSQTKEKDDKATGVTKTLADVGSPTLKAPDGHEGIVPDPTDEVFDLAALERQAAMLRAEADSGSASKSQFPPIHTPNGSIGGKKRLKPSRSEMTSGKSLADALAKQERQLGIISDNEEGKKKKRKKKKKKKKHKRSSSQQVCRRDSSSSSARHGRHNTMYRLGESGMDSSRSTCSDASSVSTYSYQSYEGFEGGGREFKKYLRDETGKLILDDDNKPILIGTSATNPDFDPSALDNLNTGRSTTSQSTFFSDLESTRSDLLTGRSDVSGISTGSQWVQAADGHKRKQKKNETREERRIRKQKEREKRRRKAALEKRKRREAETPEERAARRAARKKRKNEELARKKKERREIMIDQEIERELARQQLEHDQNKNDREFFASNGAIDGAEDSLNVSQKDASEDKRNDRRNSTRQSGEHEDIDPVEFQKEINALESARQSARHANGEGESRKLSQEKERLKQEDEYYTHLAKRKERQKRHEQDRLSKSKEHKVGARIMRGGSDRPSDQFGLYDAPNPLGISDDSSDSDEMSQDSVFSNASLRVGSRNISNF